MRTTSSSPIMALGQGWSSPLSLRPAGISFQDEVHIETELKKRKGIVEHRNRKVKPKNAEDCLYELPENIRVSSAKKTEEMLFNQMLSGIPEVDLALSEFQTHGRASLPPLGRRASSLLSR